MNIHESIFKIPFILVASTVYPVTFISVLEFGCDI